MANYGHASLNTHNPHSFTLEGLYYKLEDKFLIGSEMNICRYTVFKSNRVISVSKI